jgi:hypothetical protein
MSERGASLSFKTRQSHAIRFSSKPMVMKVTGLKTYRGPKRKHSSAWFLTRLLFLLSQKKRLIQKVAGEVLSESVTG